MTTPHRDLSPALPFDDTSDPATTIQSLNTLAWELAYSDPALALAQAEAALHLARQSSADPDVVSATVLTLAHVYDQADHPLKAQALALEALALAKIRDHLNGQAQALRVLASINISLGEYADALDNGLSGLRILQDCAADQADPLLSADVLIMLGLTYQYLQEAHTAQGYLQQSLAIYEQFNHQRGQAEALRHCSEIHRQLRAYEAALTVGMRSLTIYRQIGNQREAAQVMQLVGLVYQECHEPEQALSYLQQALDQARHFNNRLGELQSLLSLGDFYLRQGQLNFAHDPLHQALEIATKLGYQEEQFRAHQHLASLYKQTGDYAAALDHFEHFHRIQRQVFNDRANYRIRSLELNHQAEVSQKEAEIYQLHNARLSQEIAERQRALEELALSQTKLQESQQMLSLVLDSVPQTIFWKSKDGVYLGCNQAAAVEMGYPFPQEVIGKTDSELGWKLETLELIQATDQQVIKDDTVQFAEEPFVMKLMNGQQEWQMGQKIPLHNGSGQLIGLLGSYTNVTALKQAQNSLRQSEIRFRMLVDLQADLINCALPDTTITYSNRAHQRMIGYDPTGLQWSTLLHPDEYAVTLAMIQQLTPASPIVRKDTRERDAEGQIHWVEWTDQAVFDPDGTLLEIQSVGRNITQRKQAELELAQSQAQLQLALSAVEMGIWELDYVRHQVFWSPETYTLYGISPEPYRPITQEFFHSLVHSEDRECVEQVEAKILQQPGSVGFEFRLIRPDGSCRWILSQGRCIRDQEGIALKIVGINMDITQRKQAEDALRISELQLRTLIDNLPFRIWVRDADCRLLLQNPADIADFGDQVGLPMSELARAHALDFDSKQIQLWRENFQRVLKGETIRGEEIQRIRGESRTTSKIYLPIPNRAGGLDVLGVGIDITEQKRMEAALRDSQAQLQAIVDNAPIGIKVKDLNHRITLVNPQDAARFGQTPSDMIGKTLHELFPDPLATQWQAEDEWVLEQGQAIQYEETVPLPDSLHTALAVKFPIRNAEGEITGLCSMFLDITERKQIEQALQRSEERFRQMFESAPIGVVLSDVQTLAILQANPQFQQMLDYTAEQLSDLTLAAITHPDDFPAEQLQIDQLKNGSLDFFQIEKRFLTQSGEPVWTSLTANLIRDPSGIPLYKLSMVQDITARRQSEQRLAQLAAIVESSIDAIISTDLEGMIISWNQGAELTYGYTADQVLGQPLMMLSRQPNGDPLPPLSSGDPRETIHYHQDGRPIDVFLSASAIEDSNGELAGIAWIARDISDRRAVERKKDEFVSMVSHELRTPLTAIHGSLAVLTTGKLGDLAPKGQRLLEIAEQNTSRLIRLINNILDLERFRLGSHTLQRQLCTCEDVILRACEPLAPLAEKAGIQIQRQPCDAQFSGDRDQLIQVLTNLIGNAIKFSPTHGTIWVRGEAQGSQLCLQVQDQGRGIPADKLELIFERFEQVDASDSRHHGGTGLGLAICQRIVQRHGGRIWAESELGVGSTFFVRIPLG